jgi:hypothetical protein
VLKSMSGAQFWTGLALHARVPEHAVLSADQLSHRVPFALPLVRPLPCDVAYEVGRGNQHLRSNVTAHDAYAGVEVLIQMIM